MAKNKDSRTELVNNLIINKTQTTVTNKRKARIIHLVLGRET